MFSTFDCLYLASSTLSILTSISSFIFIYKLSRGSGSKNGLSLIQRTQLAMFFALFLYHSVSLSSFLVDIIYCEAGEISYWDGENIKGWFSLVSQGGIDWALINGAFWVVLLDLKLATITENNLFQRIKSWNTKTAFLSKTSTALNLAVFILRVAIAICCRGDGGRVSMWSSMQVDVCKF